jgi:glycosyltransferase involved in cell wall biosynthesis
VVAYLGINPAKVRVIYPGLAASFRPPSSAEVSMARSAFSLPEDAIFVLAVSTGASYKNVEGTIRILAQLSNSRRRNIYLVRAGRPLTQPQVKMAAELKVHDRIIELGRIADGQMHRVYWAANALLFPSHYEGFGWPVIEAMACGVPVVTSDAPAIIEASGSISPSFAAGDASGMAGAINRLLNDYGYRREVVDAGINWVQRFGWAHTARQMIEVYQEVADGLPSTA